MATVIDTLAIELGVDASKLIAQLRTLDKQFGEFERRADASSDAVQRVGDAGEHAEEQLERTGKEGEASGKKISRAFASVANGLRKARSVAVEFIATVGGAYGISKLIGNAIGYGNSVQLMSKKIGVSAQQLSAWGRAAELAGGDADGMYRSLEALSKAHTELALTGNTAMLPYLSMLGVSIGDASGRMRSFDSILLDLADKFAQMDSRHAFNIGTAMGLDESTVHLLIRGRVEVEQMLKRQKEFGAVTKEEAERGRRANEVMTKGKQTLEALGRSIANSLMPFVEILVRGLDDLNRFIVKNEGAVKVFIITLSALAAAIAPVNMAVVAVTALAGAIALLYDDYQTWKMGGDSLIDWNKWKPGIDAAAFGIRWLRDLLEDFFFRVFAAKDALNALWDRDWKALDRSLDLFVNGTGKVYGGVPKQWEEAGKAAAAGKPYNPGKDSVRHFEDRSAGTDQRTRRRDQAIAYFEAQGWTREQAIGIAANLEHESGFKDNAQGDKSKKTGQYLAYGIGQWHPDRQREFKRVFDKDIRESTYEEQLAFVHHELTASSDPAQVRAGKKLRGAKTAAQAGEAVSRYYERPLLADKEAAARAATANRMASEYAQSMTAYTANVAPGAAANDARISNNQTVTANIGEINIKTSATDAEGISADIGNALSDTLTAQVNYGTF